MENDAKSYKIKLYEAMERVDPEIIVHLSVQAAIDESTGLREACEALGRLQEHVKLAYGAAREMLPEGT